MSSLLVICLGWCSNFVGSEYGRPENYCRIWSTGQFNIPPPPKSHTLSVYTVHGCTLSLEWGEGMSERRYSRGATVHTYCSFIHGGNSSQPGSKIRTTEWMYLQSIKPVKHNAAKSVNRSILKKSRHIGFGVFHHALWNKLWVSRLFTPAYRGLRGLYQVWGWVSLLVVRKIISVSLSFICMQYVVHDYSPLSIANL